VSQLRASADKVYGGKSNDSLRQSGRRQPLHGGTGADRIYSGYGNDTVNSVGDDSSADYVDCGPGYDTASHAARPRRRRRNELRGEFVV